MIEHADNLTPQERLPKIVAEETDGGRRVVRFFVQVAEGQLHDEGFKPNHRMDSARELVKIGLTEFEDYLNSNLSPPRRCKTARPSPDRCEIPPEMERAREELAKYARKITDDGRSVIRLYAEVMDGSRNDEGFKPHHRIAAGKELLKRGFDYEPAPTTADRNVLEVRPTETPELITDNSELKIDEEEPVDCLAIVKRVVESMGPYEEEEEDDPGYKPDYSMWDAIMAQPQPEITEEHIEIVMAEFRRESEQRRAWDEERARIEASKSRPESFDDG